MIRYVLIDSTLKKKRLEAECIELKVIADELQHKYGKEFAQMCHANKSQKVNERLMIKMSEQAPDQLLVEKYLVSFEHII